MQTPTTTTRLASGARVSTCSSIPGIPTHSKTTGAGWSAAPASSAARLTCCHPGTLRSRSMVLTAKSSSSGAVVRQPRPGAAVHGDSVVGSTTTSAPQSRASRRRAAEGSLATTVRTPRALSCRITARPTGPQPSTIAVSRFPTSPRRTACSATAIGSVRAARSSSSLSGTTWAIDASTSTCSAYPPGASGESPIGCTPSAPRTKGKATTREPIGNERAVPRPCATTSPHSSCPRTVASVDRMLWA